MVAKIARCLNRGRIRVHHGFLLLWYTAVLMLPVSLLYANDGTFAGAGSAVYPMTKTSVSFEREDLVIKVRDNVAMVMATFQFRNLEKTAQEVLVGFVAPGYAGDMPGPTTESPVREFTTLVNGEPMRWKMMVKDPYCDSCALFEPGSYDYEQSPDYGPDYVFLSSVRFEPGITEISHSYQYTASSSVCDLESYYYVLSTGSMWAGNTIGHFQVDIDMGPNCVFWVSEIDSTAKWKVVGSGKIGMQSDGSGWYVGVESAHRVFLRSGVVRLSAESFRPSVQLAFGIEHPWCKYFPNDGDSILAESLNLAQGLMRSAYARHDEIERYDLSPLELRSLRNTIYALHGYQFHDTEVRRAFELCSWYLPDPNVTMENIVPSEREQAVIDQIVRLEQQSRVPTGD